MAHMYEREVCGVRMYAIHTGPYIFTLTPKNLIMKSGIKTFYISTLVVFASLSVASAQLLLEDTFGGSATSNLNGESATYFNTLLTDSGGSATWLAKTGTEGNFWADGSLTSTTQGNFDGSAFLNIGSYINDSKGNSDALFKLSATVEITGGSQSGRFVSLGFFDGTMLVGEAFFTKSRGLGTAIQRAVDVDATNYFAGPGSTNSDDPGDLSSGSVTFSILLDLRTYNGIDDFGTVSFSSDGGDSYGFSYTYKSDYSFSQIGFSFNDTPSSAQFSDLSLTQIPELGTFSLLSGCSALAFILVRRRRR
ncbi:hypothetical protein [Ruficoccus sp. ZRK36]|uniref:hypothetical protein n=1 Tax=Ruficoccus sp. ZRK36 TaxID=2866311 RepID=UPI001C72B831|nr:hypothetical protein [Ruficoccus sp. ZRK36]QYY37261.1 hypothetical protein K0V07_07200 [Ruficoccus sp. ZRK36]